ncbi:hypothetical protein JB92DRAFT_2747165 [Gautieria morchelliformis]|nr:hypothetical protein JB92DRAFT_2747165 [Gautieria morchelliformis]
MSNFFLECTVCLSGGNRQSSVAPASGNRTWHCYYNSAIKCNDRTLLPVDIRIYSPMNDVVHPDLTMGRVIGRAVKPPDGPMLVDAYVITPFPGDPVSPQYDIHLPQSTTAYVWALGTVMTPLEQMPDGKSRCFNLAVSDFVRDSNKLSTLQ